MSAIDWGCGGRTEGRWRRFQAISCALDGMGAREIAVVSGLSVANVHQVCCRSGVKLAPEPPTRARVDAAVMQVAAGACIVDAAADHGLSLETVNKHVTARGVTASATAAGRKDGRSKRAAARVLFDGESVCAASRAERVSTSATVKMIWSVKARLGR